MPTNDLSINAPWSVSTMLDEYITVTTPVPSVINNSCLGGTGGAGTNGITYGNIFNGYTVSTGTSTLTYNNIISGTSTQAPLVVYGDANIEGELTVRGVKLSDRLDAIEEKLAILHPNLELEEKWENLRGLRNAYVELEKEIREKEKIWSSLRK